MNEVKSSNLFPKAVVKGGLVFGVAAAVLNLLGVIPILGFFFSVFVLLVGVAGGYAVITAVGGSKDKLPEVIKFTVIAGVISGLVSGFGGGAASVLNGLFFSRMSFFGVYYTPGLADFIAWVLGAMVWGVFWLVLWNVLGGVLQVYYGPEKLPASIRTQLDKVKAFLNK